ncbi:Ethylene-insensitive protein 2 [Zea mays]|uniref:Ethylene-insensitive protein 2 n=1 Tax=Zea mays TaxID=4577 RepID=A0A1D6L0W3_MAIZE|nr:Ethylene-insensitive protein 2 [Zea mays]
MASLPTREQKTPVMTTMFFLLTKYAPFPLVACRRPTSSTCSCLLALRSLPKQP